MPTMRSPGVYVEEVATLPPSVAEVSTAVPAFIGYTARGDAAVPTRIENMKEYEEDFGGPPEYVRKVTETTFQKGDFTSTFADNIPLLYYSLRLYFDNGGGPCYIVSAGLHTDAVSLDKLKAALAALETEDEPTLIVMPDAVRLVDDDSSLAAAAALDHCGKMKNRFAILDVKKGVEGADFRTKVASDSLSYGAAYTPYLKTAIPYAFDETTVEVTPAADPSATSPSTPVVSAGLADYTGKIGDLPVTCKAATGLTPKVTTVPAATGAATTFTPVPDPPTLEIKFAKDATGKDVAVAWATWKTANPTQLGGFEIPASDAATAITAQEVTLQEPVKPTPPVAPSQSSTRKLVSLKKPAPGEKENTALYNQVKTYLGGLRITLPPSGAVAGIYARVDRDRGVWKAPANVSVASVLALDRTYSQSQLDGLNVDPTSGKSINVIRTFTGRGTLVWGARTLAGNDNEWRYVPVRRLFIMIEVSAQKATAFAVFEPNTSETWLKVKAMIESFLYGLWERGALAGAKPEDAYFVQVGLGSTMSAQDILEGRMIVKIGVAAVRPAEFILLQFSHKMQVS